MGLLSLGTPLSWEKAKTLADEIRKHRIEQFLHIWRKNKDRQDDSLLWGDEVEYFLVSLDHKGKHARLSLRGHELLAIPQKEEEERLELAKLSGEEPVLEALWRPEFGRYQIEGTPGHPYGPTVDEMVNVEPNMKRRRQIVSDGQEEVAEMSASKIFSGSADF
ncbi:glutamate--cysteine ligase, partial [Dipsacomyces acuminosporus]